MAKKKKSDITVLNPKLKVFAHNKELDKLKISIPFNEIELEDQYPHTDYDSLIFGKDRYLSDYLFPNPNISDVHLYYQLNTCLNPMNRNISRNPSLITTFSELEEGGKARLDGKSIEVSLMPLFDHRVDFHTRIDTIIGVDIHEALHVRLTTPGIAAKCKALGHMKNKVGRGGAVMQEVDFEKGLKAIFTTKLLASLHNILEDKRIEDTCCDEMPGYSFYLNQSRKYGFFQHVNRFENPTPKDKEKLAFNPESDKSDVIYTNIMRYIGFKTLCPQLLKYKWNEDLDSSQQKVYDELKEKVDKILASYSRDFNITFDQAVQLSRLFPEKFQGQAPFGMEGMMAETTQDSSEDKNGENENMKGLAKALKDALGELKQMIEAETAEESEQEIKKPITDNGSADYSRYQLIKAQAGEFREKEYKEALAMSRSIEKNFAFLESRFDRVIENFEQQQGHLDDDELHSLQFNPDVFYEEEDVPTYGLDLGILIDESGSMSGNKIYNARIASLAMALALHNKKHINLFVYGHTADQSWTDKGEMTLIRYLDPIDKDKGAQDINNLFTVKARSNNADGWAINALAEIMKKSQVSERILIVISDGYPAASCYGGSDGEAHVRKVVTELERQGYFVIQIAVDDINSEKMFTHYVPYSEGKDLGGSLKKILMKKITQIMELI